MKKASPEVLPRADIVPRNPDFGEYANLPKHWAMNNRFTTFSHSIFSIIITEGEHFFIRSVLPFKNRIDDPQLLHDIDHFIAQEAMHTRHHIKFNLGLRKFGFNVHRIEKNTNRFFRVMEKCLTQKGLLALTVFLEHLTTLLAATGYRFPELRVEWDRPARDFWTWHGLEEMEHKSVAFDVFKHVGGGYFTRITAALMMIMVILVLPVFLIGAWVRFGRHENAIPPTSLKERFRKHPGLRRAVIKFILEYLFAYFKPSFHPWDNDCRAHIEQWKNEIRIRL